MAMQPRKKKCMTCLPQDIVELILVRLPVSTLLRCRGVCRQWDGIVRDPQFIVAHLQRAPRCPLLFFERQFSLGKLHPSEAILFDEASSPSRWDVPVIEPDDFLCASCNGLICLYSSKSTIKIANLATGECMHLAKPVKNSRGDHFSFYSFGFHPVTKEYKVMHFLRDEQLCISDFFSVIQVYTLGDEHWRDVRTPKALSLKWVKRCGVVNVEGAMYWLTEDMESVLLKNDMESSWELAVVCFDLNEERFEWIQLPAVDFANCAPGNPLQYQITEIDGKVSMVQIRRDFGLMEKLQIWTLDSQVEQSWSHKYSIQLPSPYILGPYFIHGDKIVMHDIYSDIYCYELMGQSFEIELLKMVKLLDFSPRWGNNMQSYMYVKSLVRLDAYKKAGIVRRPKRRDGWELKKWEVWAHELRKLEKQWRMLHQLEHQISELLQRIGADINLGLQYPPDQARSPRRPNWVEQKQEREMLNSNIDRLEGFVKVMEQAVEVACREKMIPVADQVKVFEGAKLFMFTLIACALLLFGPVLTSFALI